MAISALAALHKGAQVLSDLNKLARALEKAKSWIMVRPEGASDELSKLVAEILKAPDVVNLAVGRLLAFLDTGQPTWAGLNELASGKLVQEVESKRPHCHDIARISDVYLSQILASGTRGANADELVHELANPVYRNDADLFAAFTGLSQAVVEIARKAQEHLTASDPNGAMKVIREVAPQLLLAQRKANEVALRLRQLQIDFRCKALGIDPQGV